MCGQWLPKWSDFASVTGQSKSRVTSMTEVERDGCEGGAGAGLEMEEKYTHCLSSHFPNYTLSQSK